MTLQELKDKFSESHIQFEDKGDEIWVNGGLYRLNINTPEWSDCLGDFHINGLCTHDGKYYDKIKETPTVLADGYTTKKYRNDQ